MKKLWIAAGFAAMVAGITAVVVKISRNHRDRPDDEAEVLAMPATGEGEAPAAEEPAPVEEAAPAEEEPTPEDEPAPEEEPGLE